MSGFVALPPVAIPPAILAPPTSPVPPISFAALFACAAISWSRLLPMPETVKELRPPPIFRMSGFNGIPLGTERYDDDPMQESCMHSFDLLESWFLK